MLWFASVVELLASTRTVEAVEEYKVMRLQGLVPDISTYTALVKACMQQGLDIPPAPT